jgi:putative MATE family efflux protein
LTQKEKKLQKQDRLFVLSSMPVNKAVITLAIPAIIANIIQFVYNLTDTYFVGQLGNAFMVAAIGLCMPVIMVLQSFGNMFSIGGASLISRLLGAGRTDDARKVASVSFWSALTVSITISVFAMFFIEPISRFSGADNETITYTTQYLFYLLLGAPFMAMQMALNGILRSEGANDVSMRGMIAGSVLNMILDPIFILGFKWGIIGAAVATTIGNIFGFIWNVSFYFKKKAVLTISPKEFVFKWEYFRDIFKIGIPASFGMLLMSTAQVLANKVAVGFGNDLIAANNIVMRVTNIALMFTMGLTAGCQPLLGFSYGAQKYKRLNDAIKFTIVFGTAMNVLFALVMWFAADFWISVFINIPEIIALGVRIIHVMVFSMPFMALQMTLMTVYQSLGKTVQALIVSLGRQGLFFVPALYIFSSMWGIDGYIWANPFANIFTALVSAVMYLFMRKSFPKSSDEDEGIILEPGMKIATDEN